MGMSWSLQLRYQRIHGAMLLKFKNFAINGQPTIDKKWHNRAVSRQSSGGIQKGIYSMVACTCLLLRTALTRGKDLGKGGCEIRQQGDCDRIARFDSVPHCDTELGQCPVSEIHYIFPAVIPAKPAERVRAGIQKRTEILDPRSPLQACGAKFRGKTS